MGLRVYLNPIFIDHPFKDSYEDFMIRKPKQVRFDRVQVVFRNLFFGRLFLSAQTSPLQKPQRGRV